MYLAVRLPQEVQHSLNQQLVRLSLPSDNFIDRVSIERASCELFVEVGDMTSYSLPSAAMIYQPAALDLGMLLL